MNKLQRKLRSRTGASMILALLFLMFCSFVGGSVLVSATANAYRVTHLEEQQAFLDQRSAALLLSDELQVAEGKRFRLYILDADKHIEEGFVNQYGEWQTSGDSRIDPAVDERVITFQLLTDVTAVSELQELMLQTTVWRYLRNNAAGETCIVQIKDKNGTEVDLNSFWYSFPGVSPVKENGVTLVTIPAESTKEVGGQLTFSAQLGQDVSGISSLGSYQIYFYSMGEKSDSGTEDEVPPDLFDFVLDFGTGSQLKLVMDGYSGTSEDITVTGTPTVGNLRGDNDPTGQIKVKTTSNQTLVSWEDPAIEKGGAEG